MLETHKTVDRVALSSKANRHRPKLENCTGKLCRSDWMFRFLFDKGKNPSKRRIKLASFFPDRMFPDDTFTSARTERTGVEKIETVNEPNAHRLPSTAPPPLSRSIKPPGPAIPTTRMIVTSSSPPHVQCISDDSANDQNKSKSYRCKRNDGKYFVGNLRFISGREKSNILFNNHISILRAFILANHFSLTTLVLVSIQMSYNDRIFRVN